MILRPEDLPIHGGQIAALAEHFNIPASSLLDFSANINPDGPPPTAIHAIHSALEDHSTITDYPDLRSRALKRALATYAEVEPEQIAIANGFVPLLEATLRSLPIRSCLLPIPAFGEYCRVLERAHVETNPQVLSPESSFQPAPERLLEVPCDALLLANPQNPSGATHSPEAIQSLAQSASRRNRFLLLDEAFIDYLPHESLAPQTSATPNLIVFRSVTKFFAMPGLRVAYAIAHPDRIAAIDHHLAPWPITTLAAHATAAAVADRTYAHQTIERNHHRRTNLQRSLESLDLHVYPSSANFLLLRLPTRIDPIAFWQSLIVDHHIVTRSCANYEGLPPGHLRIAIRREEDNRQLVRALQHLLRTPSP